MKLNTFRPNFIHIQQNVLHKFSPISSYFAEEQIKIRDTLVGEVGKKSRRPRLKYFPQIMKNIR